MPCHCHCHCHSSLSVERIDPGHGTPSRQSGLFTCIPPFILSDKRDIQVECAEPICSVIPWTRYLLCQPAEQFGCRCRDSPPHSYRSCRSSLASFRRYSCTQRRKLRRPSQLPSSRQRLGEGRPSSRGSSSVVGRGRGGDMRGEGTPTCQAVELVTCHAK